MGVRAHETNLPVLFFEIRTKSTKYKRIKTHEYNSKIHLPDNHEIHGCRLKEGNTLHDNSAFHREAACTVLVDSHVRLIVIVKRHPTGRSWIVHSSSASPMSGFTRGECVKGCHNSRWARRIVGGFWPFYDRILSFAVYILIREDPARRRSTAAKRLLPKRVSLYT